jgi:hypothetical protein
VWGVYSAFRRCTERVGVSKARDETRRNEACSGERLRGSGDYGDWAATCQAAEARADRVWHWASSERGRDGGVARFERRPLHQRPSRSFDVPWPRFLLTVDVAARRNA